MVAPTPDGSAVYAYLSGESEVARLSVTAGSRDLLFAADPTGGSNQYEVFDMTVGPDGGLAVSFPGAIAVGGVLDVIYPGGTIAIFDNGVLRPKVDSNSQGRFANDPATYNLAFNESGSLLYGYNSFLSTFELKRESVSAQGVQWLSSTGGLISGYYSRIRYSRGLLYTSYGDVVDPERSVVVGRFADDWLSRGNYADVVPDVGASRAYFVTTSGILVFDINTYALLARLPITTSLSQQLSLVRFGTDGLAFVTASGQLYIVSISAIPLLPTQVPPPQLPFIAPNGIVPIFSSVPVVQPGSWISIFGANLASSTVAWNNDFPTTLGGTTVSINNKPAFLAYVSPTQLYLQVPDDSTSGTVSVSVTTTSGTATGSVSLSQFAPALSLLDNQYVAAKIITPDGSGAYELVGPAGYFNFETRPVKPGETLALFGVGFGPTNPSVPAGQAFIGTAPTTNTVTVKIGGKSASVSFSGIVAAGLYQINVVVPSIPSGDQPVQAIVGGASAPLATVTVQ